MTAAAAASTTPDATKTLMPGLLERLMVSSPASGRVNSFFIVAFA
jgi:hypothetical protein